MSSPSRGIIYIVTGQKFVNEACRSAASVKRWMPDVPITMFSDEPTHYALFDQYAYGRLFPVNDHPISSKLSSP